MKEEKNNIDHFLKETLNGYHPSPSTEAWEGVSRKLPLVSTVQFLRFNRYYILAVMFVGLLITSVWLYTHHNFTENMQVKQIKTNENFTPDIPKQATINKKQETLKASDPSDLHKDEPKNIPQLETADSKPQKPDNLKAPIAEVTGKTRNDIHEVSGEPDPVKDENVQGSWTQKTMPSLRTILLDEIPVVWNFQGSTRLQSQLTNPLFDQPTRKDYFPGSDISCAINLYPEVVMANSRLKPSYGFELTGLIVGKDYLFEAGTGISRTGDDGNYLVSYSQYDSTGFYYKVSSFSIDPVTGKPIYKTSPEVVYDTIDYKSSLSTGNYYTYARFPQSAGNSMLELKRISLWLKAGAVWSAMLSSEENDPEFRNNKALYFTVENNTPSRIKSFWQLSAGL